MDLLSRPYVCVVFGGLNCELPETLILLKRDFVCFQAFSFGALVLGPATVTLVGSALWALTWNMVDGWYALASRLGGPCPGPCTVATRT